QSISNNQRENKQNNEPWDMVLIYSGGANRVDGWFGGKYLDPYIMLEKEDGTFDWLFDGFLFLEIRDGEKSFFGSHGEKPANKEDWKSYADKFFMPDYNITALNNRLEMYKSKNGATSPFKKRKIIIGIPEAKEGQKDWGAVDGENLDFDVEEDRIVAYKWFIDYAKNQFDAQNYGNVELVAFYWIQEGKRIENTILEVSEYIHSKDYLFYWIPHLLGASNVDNNWEELGFDRAYLQPGYFYRTDKHYNRLAESSELVKKYGFTPYVEFSPQALKRRNNWGYRLYNTIDVFNEHGFWDSYPVGYYQSSRAWYQMFISKNKEDRDLYYRLAEIIARRQKEFNIE
ncbi:MAG: DUF4855 domain-containing protein, partial [Bacteroidaceae bacterium]|nr:DUF4855 domain-containing protein [Bacteroidaceae bacterium]